MSLLRVLVTTRVTVAHAFRVDGVLTDAAGDVTVTVARLDGTDAGSGTATHGTTGVYTFALTPSDVVDLWTVTWSGSIGGATVAVRDIVEIVGGFLFGLDEAREELKIPTSTSDATLAAKRIEVEQECEGRCCQQAFVPRFEREILSGSGSERLTLRHPLVRSVRAVTVSGTAWTPAQLATIGPTDDGLLCLPAGSEWPVGLGNVIVEYEYGMDAPPYGLSSAAITRLGSKLSARSNAIPARALSYVAADGGSYRLSLPTRYTTGIPDVDAEYGANFRPRRPVIA